MSVLMASIALFPLAVVPTTRLSSFPFARTKKSSAYFCPDAIVSTEKSLTVFLAMSDLFVKELTTEIPISFSVVKLLIERGTVFF